MNFTVSEEHGRHSVTLLLDAMQRTTFFVLIAMFVVLSSVSQASPIVIASIAIPDKAWIAASLAAVFIGDWQLLRISVKITQTIRKCNETTWPSFFALIALHHWFLCPFDVSKKRLYSFFTLIPAGTFVGLNFFFVFTVAAQISLSEPWTSVLSIRGASILQYFLVSVFGFLLGDFVMEICSFRAFVKPNSKKQLYYITALTIMVWGAAHALTFFGLV